MFRYHTRNYAAVAATAAQARYAAGMSKPRAQQAKETTQQQAAAEEPAAAQEQPNAEEQKASGSKIGRLMKEYGAPFVIWYLIVEEGSWAALTAVLHYGLLGDIDATTLLEKCGASYDFSGNSMMVFGYEISAKLMANIGAAGAVVTVGSPAILGFCLMTLPLFRAVTRPISRRFMAGPKTAAPSTPPPTK